MFAGDEKVKRWGSDDDLFRIQSASVELPRGSTIRHVSRRALAPELCFIPVLGSNSASLMFLTISVMLLMVPFLDYPRAESVVGGSVVVRRIGGECNEHLEVPSNKELAAHDGRWCEEIFTK